MKLAASSFQPKIAFAMPVAALLSILALAVPAGSIAATDAQGAAHVLKIASQDRIDTHISDLHAKLKITVAQEKLWQKVAQVIRDNASKMDSLRQERIEDTKRMTAVGDLKSYGDIAEAHADGVKRLLPAFQDLYSSMSDVQKSNADLIFRSRQHHASRKN